MIKIHSSSNIDAVDWDEITKILAVTYKGNIKYEYHDVPLECYQTIEELNGNPEGSVGKFINEAVKGVYKYNQVVTKESLEKELKKLIVDFQKVYENSDDREEYWDGWSVGVENTIDRLRDKFGLNV